MIRGKSTPGAVLRELVKLGALPEGGTINPRRGVHDWDDRGLWFRFMLNRDRPDRYPSGLYPKLFVSAGGELGVPVELNGVGTTIGIVSDGPFGGTPDDPDGLLAFTESAREFVTGPSDLCLLLMQEKDVHRGNLHTWLYQGYPARLVKALLLARHLKNTSLEAEILSVLHSGIMLDVAPGGPEDVLTAARSQAKIITRRTGLKIEL